MLFSLFHRYLIVPLLVLPLALTASAQNNIEIGSLTELDRQYMIRQQAVLEDLSTRHFGQKFSGRRDDDLALLQRMLDERLVRKNQIGELQAMGVILGNLLAEEFNLKWVTYTDKLGRSRALKDGMTDNYVFPITMISRRWAVDNRKPVKEIYNKASHIVKLGRPRAPYQ